MVRPERRTKADVAAAVVLVAAVIAGSAVVWFNSDARATVSQTAPRPLPEQPPAVAVPPTLTEAWRAPSPATPVPVVAGPAVVTGAGSEVVGRDPVTGQPSWSYSRDIPLCTVGSEWNRALAVYRKSHNCSEVTSLRGATGVRGPQRNSDAEFGTRLLSDGTYVTATGRRTFESWRSDMVLTEQYGIPVDLKNPDNNIERPDCTYSSVAVGEARIGVIEKCPGTTLGDRVTMLKTHPKDYEKSEQVFSTGLGSTQTSVVAVNEKRVAVLVRDRSEVLVYNTGGSIAARYPVHLGPADLHGNVQVEPTRTGSHVYWHTGADTLALDPTTLTPQWTVPDALGPGIDFGGRVLVPVRDGLAVLDPATGARECVIPVDRHGYPGPVQLGAAGSTLLEQRGDTLVALR
ncbi:Rv3212 family protein [Saccharopolyspora rosea]|uniref:Rv3212 family protein n=1 Tax=Saccharopolyspora rosea TaxID=524884 RepID=UPI0021D8F9EB|nr:hypothetical protein [Saccharopolyspora rosea]